MQTGEVVYESQLACLTQLNDTEETTLIGVDLDHVVRAYKILRDDNSFVIEEIGSEPINALVQMST